MTEMIERLEIARPDDWHLHLRDGAALRAVLPHTAARFGRAVVMPNLRPPVVTTEDALAYRERILAALPTAGSGEPGSSFQPLMTLYLTDRTTPEEIRRARESGLVVAAKLYPAGATTNSDSGVTDVARVDDALVALAEEGLLLLVHGEVTDSDVDVFDREAVFLERVLAPLVERHPTLRVVFEHVTTREAVEYVASAREGVAATMTPQHLSMDRGALFEGGLRPHHYCLPVLKRREHRDALVAAATSGSPRFFLGTDSAPHAVGAKEADCGCAGIYSAHAGIELYAEVFEAAGALHRLEGFASHHGADFYGLPRNSERMTLVREAWTPPAFYAYGDESLRPLRAGETVAWKLAD